MVCSLTVPPGLGWICSDVLTRDGCANHRQTTLMDSDIDFGARCGRLSVRWQRSTGSGVRWGHRLRVRDTRRSVPNRRWGFPDLPGRPSSRRKLVGPPAEQERVGALVHLVDERHGLVVEQRPGPSASLESAAAVSSGPPFPGATPSTGTCVVVVSFMVAVPFSLVWPSFRNSGPPHRNLGHRARSARWQRTWRLPSCRR